ncbi:MAG: patatin-like phospholipase family protein [Acidobacteriota bacterium]
MSGMQMVSDAAATARAVAHVDGPEETHAVVFSGGGADGAYEVGVLKALCSGRSPTTGYEPIEPKIFVGTSIGSFNAAYLVSQWDEYGLSSISNLATTWLERIADTDANPRGGGTYRIRLNPLDLIDPRRYVHDPIAPLADFTRDVTFLGWDGVQRVANLFTDSAPMIDRVSGLFNIGSLVSVAPWEKTLRETINYRNLRRSSRTLRIAATNWAQGEVRVFGNHDMTDRMGPQVIRASSAVPGFFPVAQVGAQPYVDGAVLMNTPLKPAVHAGGTVLHVIYMNADVKNMPLKRLESTVDSLYRTQIIAWAEAVNRDIKRAASYNEGLAMLARAHDAQEVQGDDAEHYLGAAGPVLRRLKQGRLYRPLTIHRYYPRDGLDDALGFFDVRRTRIERLIEQGFADAVNYDVDVRQSVVPDAQALALLKKLDPRLWGGPGAGSGVDDPGPDPRPDPPPSLATDPATASGLASPA